MGLVSLSSPFVETKDVDFLDGRFIEAPVFAACLSVSLIDMEAKLAKSNVIVNIVVKTGSKRYIDIWCHGRVVMRAVTTWDGATIEKAMKQFNPVAKVMTVDELRAVMVKHAKDCRDYIAHIKRVREEDIFSAIVSSADFIERYTEEAKEEHAMEESQIMDETKKNF